ncbi:MAG: Fur family transcriptional regulator [Acidimicrobiales bacterium]
MSTAAVHERVASSLGRSDQRYTSQRRQLVELLASAGRPLSIPEILTSRPGLAQSSVYRNLDTLERAGAVRRVLGADEFARYELDEALTEHHHHLVCTSCRRITDFQVPARHERSLERVLDEAAAGSAFRVVAHRLDLFGLCAGCA